MLRVRQPTHAQAPPERRGVRRGLSQSWLKTAIVAGYLVTTGTAWADARTEARKHFRAGMTLIARGLYERGIGELENAYELLPHPNVLFNIARAYTELGEVENSITFYKRYLESHPPDADEVNRMVEQLQARLEQQRAALAAAQPSPPAPAVSGAAPTSNSSSEAATTTEPNPAPAVPTATARDSNAEPNKQPTEASGEERSRGVQAGAALETHNEDVFQETVVTASRTAQSPVDAPNSISIITEQDIHLSGITKIPDLLRRLAGVDVATLTGADTEVSIRGFNSRISNKTLVLIDYRSVYVDILGTTVWETFPIDIEEIDRIEVVRGAGSALYGANAFAGVINIITKRPGEGRSSLRAGAGNYGGTFASTYTTQRSGDTAYRVSAGYARDPRWSREVSSFRNDIRIDRQDQNTGTSTTRFDALIERQLTQDSFLTVGGGLARSFLNYQGLGSLRELDLDGTTGDAEATLNLKHFTVRAFYNRLDMTVARAQEYATENPLQSRARSHVVDVQAELAERFNTSPLLEHDTHVGVSYRLKNVTWQWLDGKHTEHWFGIFGQDAITVAKRVQLVASGRLDYVPFLQEFIPSPRGALVVHPTEQSAVRLSGSTAFRSPSFVESYLDVPLASPSAPGVGSQAAARRPDQGGTFKVRPEKALSVDLGYVNQDSDLINFEITGYYLQAKDLITLAPTRPETPSTYPMDGFNTEGGFYTAAYAGWANQCLVYNTYGSELSARVFPREGLDLFANYSLNLQSATRPIGCTDVENKQTSVHKINAGVQVRTRQGFDGELTFHYVSNQLWAERVPATDGSANLVWATYPLPAYTLLNARIGYRFFQNNAEVSATAFNLLNQVHQQHPFGQTLGQRFMGFLSYRFLSQLS